MAESKAKPRRQHGTGSIHERADGYWVGTLEAGWTARGTRRRITVVRKTKAAAKNALADKRREIETHGLPTTNSRTTVKAWADDWLEITSHKVRPKTWATNRSAVNLWIIPTIGHKRLDALTPGDIRSVSTAIRKAGRSTSTASRCHVVLLKMLRDATVEGHPVPHRLLLVDGPSVATSDRDAVDQANALAMLAAAADLPDGSRWVAAFLQGMRQGECLGLEWGSIDFARGLVDVSWQLQPLPYEHGCTPRCGRRFGGDCPDRRPRVPDGYEYRQLDGALCLVRPKTAKGQRIIPLVPWMATALQHWRTIAPDSPHDLVWPRADGRPGLSSDDRAAWYALQDAAKVRHATGRHYYLHEARHTTATLLLEAGVDPEVVKAILGHSSIVTSRGYQHVSTSLARDAMDKIAQRLQLNT